MKQLPRRTREKKQDKDKERGRIQIEVRQVLKPEQKEDPNWQKTLTQDHISKIKKEVKNRERQNIEKGKKKKKDQWKVSKNCLLKD